MSVTLTRTDLEQIGEASRETGFCMFTSKSDRLNGWELDPDCGLAEALRDIIGRHLEHAEDRDRKLAARVARQVMATLDRREES